MPNLLEIAHTGLSSLEIQHLYKTVIEDYPPETKETELSPTTSAILLTASLLKRVSPPLLSEQRQLVFNSLLPEIRNLSPTRSLILVFLDNCMFTHSGLQGFISLSTGEIVKTRSEKPFVSVSYDIQEFIRRIVTEIVNEKFSTDSLQCAEQP